MNHQNSPIYIFHHIPKCGGTSLNHILSQWFILKKDYRSVETNLYPSRTDLASLDPNYCLCGHFEDDGVYLHQRYPEILNSEQFRLFTFLRDPLQAKLSLIRYEASFLNCKYSADNIVNHLFERPNYLSNRFPVTPENYRKVIDRYYFVGILEEYQQGLDLLAAMIGKPPMQLSIMNRSATKGTTDIESKLITEQIVREFRDANSLDYLVYDYCVTRFHDLSCNMNRTRSTRSNMLSDSLE